MKYVALLRGINVGGKNKVAMVDLKHVFEEAECHAVRTYINSGNVIFESSKMAAEITAKVEALLPRRFQLDSELIKILILSHDELRAVVKKAPKGFGMQPEIYHSDAIFLIGVPMKEALAVFSPRKGIDMIWAGDGVVYSQRLSAQRVKSRLSKIVGTLPYRSMTIRSWSTTQKLLELIESE